MIQIDLVQLPSVRSYGWVGLGEGMGYGGISTSAVKEAGNK